MSKKRRRGKKRTAVLPVIIAGLLLICLIAGLFIHYEIELHKYDAYPMKYTSEIEAAAAEFGIEPAYMYAVALCESSFRADAVSSDGAVGLMQIMPSTGEWIAGKLDIEYNDNILTDPAVNTRLAGWYLSYLLKRYDGDKRCASAAYHAGAGTVDKWLADPEMSSDGKTLDKIGYTSTDNYVNKVMKSYEVYLARIAEGR